MEYEIQVASPGRINLIGEHTDYNKGYVLPTAIDKKIFFRMRANGEAAFCRVESKGQTLEFDLQHLQKSSRTWENYILGVVDEIQKKGKQLKGFDCVIESDLPIGAGISSSAALECGLASGLNKLFELGLTQLEIVELSQKAENNFVGSNCGIMDQYSSVMSREGHLILLDCQSLESEYITADFKDCKILLLNTNVSHSLADGEYNTRRRECEDSVALIKKKYPQVNSLRDINKRQLEEFREALPETNFERCQYVLEENERVLAAVSAIRAGKLQEFGKLMYESHHGLQHLYEVSCEELDFLVDHTRQKDFVLGSRMMGGGFGGCTINLIEADKIKAYVQEVGVAYRSRFGIDLEAITVVPSGGTEVYSS